MDPSNAPVAKKRKHQSKSNQVVLEAKPVVEAIVLKVKIPKTPKEPKAPKPKSAWSSTMLQQIKAMDKEGMATAGFWLIDGANKFVDFNDEWIDFIRDHPQPVKEKCSSSKKPKLCDNCKQSSE